MYKSIENEKKYYSTLYIVHAVMNTTLQALHYMLLLKGGKLLHSQLHVMITKANCINYQFLSEGVHN